MRAWRALAPWVAGAAMILALDGPAAAQQAPYVYPAKGQSPEKQGQDEYACYGWAKQQTGVDPLRPAAPAPAHASGDTGSGALASTAGGAAIGALGGALVGNLFGKHAKTGALLGGGSGALLGAGKADQDKRAATAAQQQGQARQQGQVADYYRAFGACMTGRGYTVS
ncbi:MAG: hypothetical protein U1E17_01865 [Geminicoccaceae bacterium]